MVGTILYVTNVPR